MYLIRWELFLHLSKSHQKQSHQTQAITMMWMILILTWTLMARELHLHLQ
jgi:hypothetical protein